MASFDRIAVIGMACRLPGGVKNPDDLWDMVFEGRDGHGRVPISRWNADAFHSPDPTAPDSTPFTEGHFIDGDIGAFDARFFGISPTEATSMDPEQRLLLEVTYEAFENAGVPLQKLRGSPTGVFVAQFCRDYDKIMQKDTLGAHKWTTLGTGDAIMANRLSYVMDLQGPSMTIDTGCSGSMISIHQACQSLRTGESDLAVAGGAQLMIVPDQSAQMSSLSMANKEGKCWVFDERAEGYGRGEGAGMLVLKRLSDAVRDGDSIHAVIANSGTNQDGKTNGIQLPKAAAQTALSRSVYAAANLDPAETIYEIASIYETFCESPNRKAKLLVGSVKANIGHCESVSGVAAVIKAILVLMKGWVPANIRLINPKPSMKLSERPELSLPITGVPLVQDDYEGPVRVSVNGFGYGGANGHMILELPVLQEAVAHGATNGLSSANHKNGSLEPSSTNGIGEHSSPRLFLLSAASESSLRDVASQLETWLHARNPSNHDLANLSHTLVARRSWLAWRYAFVASDAGVLKEKLQQLTPVKVDDGPTAQITYVFTGQGAQWHAMGRELLVASPTFLKSIRYSASLIEQWNSPWNLEEELLRDAGSSRLGESQIAQPATTAIQVAVVDMLTELGITPQRVCGHSSGEIAAAYAAGCLTHESALKASYFRGICSAEARKVNSKGGAMMAVGLGEDDVAPLVESMKARLVIACMNSPSSTTISGDNDAIEELASILESKAIFNRKLKVDTAYHSHHMQAVAQQYLDSMTSIEHQAPREGITFFSSVTAEIKTSGFGMDYWVQNLVSPVRFDSALRAAASAMSHSAKGSTANAFIEVGPHSALLGPARQVLSSALGKSFVYTYVAPINRGRDALLSTLEAAGKLIEVGCKMDTRHLAALNQSVPVSQLKVLHDLPRYPWNHDNVYWHETRASRQHRFRKFPYHDLIGVLDPVAGPQNPQWRQHLSLERLPWLRDHFIDGAILFPGTGYVAMAIEAMNQLVQLRETPGTLRRFCLRDVIFAKPLVIPDQYVNGDIEKVEILISLTPESGASSTKSPWEVFRVASYNNSLETWSEHCTGLISAEMQSSSHSLDSEESSATAQARDLEAIRSGSSDSLDMEAFYENMATHGNVYGSTFSTLTDVYVGQKQAFGRVTIPDIASGMPSKFQRPHVAHPSTLDILSHLGAAVFLREGGQLPFVFASIGEMSISIDITSKSGDELVVAGRRLDDSKRVATFSSSVFQSGSDGLEPVITFKACKLQSVGSAQTADEDHVFQRKHVFRMEWGPDVDLMDSAGLVQYIKEADESSNDETEIRDQLLARQSAALLYIRRALHSMYEKGESPDPESPHLQRYYEWMQKVTDVESPLHHIQSSSQTEILSDDDIIAKCADSGPMGEATVRIGSQLHELLASRDDEPNTLLSDELAQKIHDSLIAEAGVNRLARTLQLLSFKNPHMRILEIGAGKGGATMSVLEALESVDGPLFEHYDCTDLSVETFANARARFARWADRMDFKGLDPDKDPAAQGFELGQYDLVIAFNALHATPDVSHAVANCRSLLKDEGRLLLVELTRPTLDTGLVFGSLPGWWCEDGRDSSALLSISEWDQLVQRQGFSNVEAVPNDSELPYVSLLVAKAVKQDEPSEVADITIGPVRLVTSSHLSETQEPEHCALSTQILSDLAVRGIDHGRVPLESVQVDGKTTYIVVDDTSRPILNLPSPRAFASIQRLLTQAENVLWVSSQSSDTPEATAFKGMITGMSRVARSESPYINLVTVQVRENFIPDDVTQLSSSIIRIASVSLWSTTLADDGLREWEYAVENGHILVHRTRTDARFNSWITSSQSHGAETIETSLVDNNRPLILEAETPGMVNSLRFVDDPSHLTPLAPGDIEVEPHAWGVNFKDVLQFLGYGLEYAAPGEFAGVVRSVGADMAEQYKIGDRVVGMYAQGYASHIRVRGHCAQVLSDDMSFVEGASAVVVFLTAWYSLHTLASLQKGESILIHAASGGVGQAAIQVAQYLGATIYATVSSAAKRDHIVKEYGISPENVFRSTSTGFKDAILDRTHGRGVDVVLNSVAGEEFKASIEATAAFGRFVEIGKNEILNRGALNMAAFDRCISLVAVDLTLMCDMKPALYTKAFREVFDLLQQKKLRPVAPLTTRSISAMDTVIRDVSSRKHTGKFVLVNDPASKIKATAPRPKPVQLSRDATYVIVGGLGDIGWATSQLLARLGAGNIVTLGRSKPSDERLAHFSAEIEFHGAKLFAKQADVRDREQLEAVASWCRETLPTVRGVFHLAMVLNDRPLEIMTAAEWRTACEPKVQGTLNLDAVFGRHDELDLFMMMASSAANIGSKAQANYAAACTFQDAYAFAQNARGRHTRYVALDLGGVIGTTAVQNVNAGSTLVDKGLLLMPMREVEKIIEYALGPGAKENDMSQCITGLARQQMVIANVGDLLRNAMFSTLPKDSIVTGAAADMGTTRKQQSSDIAKLLQTAKTMEEAESIVRTATLDKYSAFLDHEVSPDRPTVQFAIDSLVSVELKNWMTRTFSTQVQAHEIAGSLSIAALSKLLTQRSSLKADGVGNVNEGPLDSQLQNGSVPRELPAHGWECCKHNDTLHRFPTSSLEKVLGHMLETTGHLLSEENLDRLKLGVEKMLRPGGTGQKLYAQFVQESNDPEIDSWNYDHLSRAMFLAKRDPVAPQTSFLGSPLEPPAVHTQCERAAILTVASLAFRTEKHGANVQPQYYLGRASCTWQSQYLFETVREPGEKSDRLMRYPGSEHIAVLRKGRLFKVPVQRDGKVLTYPELRSTFQAVIDFVGDDEGLWTGILTADNRVTWAQNRRAAMERNPRNAEYLKVVEEAIFVMCLDHQTPESDTEQINFTFFGDGFNRWFDKSYQIVVMANGKTSFIAEHGALDGMTSWSYSEAMQKAIFAHKSESDVGYTPWEGPVHVEELVFGSTPDLDAHMLAVRDKYIITASTNEYRNYYVPHFGSADLMALEVPVKSVLDITVQLASRIFYGHNTACWELLSMAHYHKGRQEIMQTCTPSVASFCAIADDDSIPLKERRSRLLALCREMATNLRQSQGAGAFMRLFEIMRTIWPTDEGADDPRLFREGLFWPQPATFTQHMPSGSAGSIMASGVMKNGSTCVMVVTDKHSFRAAIHSLPGTTAQFGRCLDRAAAIIKQIVQAK
ncbi:beta-ketoacyl synthase domain-containing protein [Sarocladium strictum]